MQNAMPKYHMPNDNIDNDVLLTESYNEAPLSVFKLNVNAPPFILGQISPPFNSVLNPNADIFIPLVNSVSENDLSPREMLKRLKMKNANKMVIGHLNINSIRNIFDSLKYIIDKNVDILLISETKLNDTFPESQFLIQGFHAPYRKDRNDKGG